MLNEKTFAELSVLCKFDFTDEERAVFMRDLNAIIAFVGKVREFDGEYDVVRAAEPVSFDSLREDEAVVTATPEQLLSYVGSVNNCYVIPKVLD